ncbi:hypothetical protein AVEN_32198-1 [Araneus ventricosus]|uniref:Uncharacterized protein n=1 Tax=Araneus ventricosus TaxID=182803 RepID=A0A4Y2VP45_ARAVE|nr:hypothetical protein AVEN_32198-1 [Araneus ventricosus]
MAEKCAHSQRIPSSSLSAGREKKWVTTSKSRQFTSLPKWNFWNTGKKKQSSVLKTDGNWHSGMAKQEFQRTENPTLHAPIPIWSLDARVEAHQRICLDWDLATRLENRTRRVGGIGGSKSSGRALWSLRE